MSVPGPGPATGSGPGVADVVVADDTDPTPDEPVSANTEGAPAWTMSAAPHVEPSSVPAIPTMAGTPPLS